MGLDDITEEYLDSSNAKMVGSLVGGYLVSEQVTGRVFNFVEQQAGGNTSVPNELNGLVTAGVFYGYGDAVFSTMTANHMAYGSLLNTVDEISNRPSVKQALPF